MALASIDATGIHVPEYADILARKQAEMRSIYGADLHLGPETQDGQLLAIWALAEADLYALAVATYQAFSPATAQGEGLSSVVKINGIRRESASYSTADLVLVGQAGTTVADGSVRDADGNLWDLPARVVIPPSGQVTVTATARAIGAVAAPAGAISSIATPTRGWQSVTNPLPAAAGAPVESDAALRARQARSTMLPSRSILDGLVGAVGDLPGVIRLAAYENDTSAPDANGLPAHSVALVVDGGDAAAIAAAILAKKAIGVGTHGTTTVQANDASGITHAVRFFRPAAVQVGVVVSLRPARGYVAATGDVIRAAVAAHVAALPIGEDVSIGRLYVPAHVAAAAGTYTVAGVAAARGGGALSAADVPIAFDEAAVCDPENVSIALV